MDRRRHVRANAVLHVRVWGLDAKSRPFTHLATIRNISDEGVLITGLCIALKAGTVVDIQYNGCRAEFLVAWVSDGPKGMAAEVGLQRVSSQPCIWESYLDRASGVEANS
jgi:hypothetical protein